MTKFRILHAFLFAVACLAAAPAVAATALARVTGIYVELEAGVRSERSGRSIEAGKPLLAEVHVPGRNGSPAYTAIVRMNAIDAAVGDMVQVNLGENGMLTGVRPTRPYIVRIDSQEAPALAQGGLLPFIPVERPPLPRFLAQREPVAQETMRDQCCP
ncbi:MAG TPA: hypothetical protein VH105_00110 [Burkholderiales bacterium]|jgi:hypothetical protein|nr:hypothetical protein [Burkholderiales bacterium]